MPPALRFGPSSSAPIWLLLAELGLRPPNWARFDQAIRCLHPPPPDADDETGRRLRQQFVLYLKNWHDPPADPWESACAKLCSQAPEVCWRLPGNGFLYNPAPADWQMPRCLARRSPADPWPRTSRCQPGKATSGAGARIRNAARPPPLQFARLATRWRFDGAILRFLAERSTTSARRFC